MESRTKEKKRNIGYNEKITFITLKAFWCPKGEPSTTPLIQFSWHIHTMTVKFSTFYTPSHSVLSIATQFIPLFHFNSIKTIPSLYLQKLISCKQYLKLIPSITNNVIVCVCIYNFFFIYFIIYSPDVVYIQFM